MKPNKNNWNKWLINYNLLQPGDVFVFRNIEKHFSVVEALDINYTYWIFLHTGHYFCHNGEYANEYIREFKIVGHNPHEQTLKHVDWNSKRVDYINVNE